MKTIKLPAPPKDAVGAKWVYPVLVDWFPHLTMDQHFANAVAFANGEPTPFPNPNMITVEIDRW